MEQKFSQFLKLVSFFYGSAALPPVHTPCQPISLLHVHFYIPIIKITAQHGPSKVQSPQQHWWETPNSFCSTSDSDPLALCICPFIITQTSPVLSTVKTTFQHHCAILQRLLLRVTLQCTAHWAAKQNSHFCKWASAINTKCRTEIKNERECALLAKYANVVYKNVQCSAFWWSHRSLKMNMKPETTLLGAEGEENKCTNSFHTEKQATFKSTVSGSSASSDEAVKR